MEVENPHWCTYMSKLAQMGQGKFELFSRYQDCVLTILVPSLKFQSKLKHNTHLTANNVSAKREQLCIVLH
jgi:hypothetical protein